MPAAMVTRTWMVDEVEGESLFRGESQQDRCIAAGRRERL